MSKLVTLSTIIIYPIKSLAGIRLNESKVEKYGLNNDRLIMLVDENGLFVTQRKYPQLALINVQLVEHQIKLVVNNHSELIIDEESFLKSSFPVKIWKDQCRAFVAKKLVNDWFSLYLNLSVKLVRYNHQEPRLSDKEFSKAGDVVSFADGFPLLVISQASLNELNSRLEKSVSLLNFRPNIVIDGCEAYEEDDWKKIRIGEIEFDVVKKCSRCILTTVDPKTGIKNLNGQPLKALSDYRKTKEGILFGMNLIPRSSGIIRLNNSIKILR